MYIPRDSLTVQLAVTHIVISLCRGAFVQIQAGVGSFAQSDFKTPSTKQSVYRVGRGISACPSYPNKAVESSPETKDSTYRALGERLECRSRIILRSHQRHHSRQEPNNKSKEGSHIVIEGVSVCAQASEAHWRRERRGWRGGRRGKTALLLSMRRLCLCVWDRSRAKG